MRLSEKKIFILILLLGCILRLINALNASAIELDGIAYARIGNLFAQGNINDALKSLMHPFYPLLLGMCYVFVKNLELAGRIVSLLSGILLIPLVFFFIRKSFDSKKALYCSFIVAIHPYLVRYSSQVLSESIAIFLFSAAFFFFYDGWTEKNVKNLGISGILLALTYLTKAEYIIYSIPFTLILLKDKKIIHTIIFCVCFLVLSFVYISFLKYETGLWIPTKKVGLGIYESTGGAQSYSYLSPIPKSFNILEKVYSVFSGFLEAMFIPFLVLMIFGFLRVLRQYRNLAIILVVVHLLVRIFLAPHATRRYSVEFVPLLLIFSVYGIYVLQDFFEKRRLNKVLYYSITLVVVCVSLYAAIAPVNRGREYHKKAGLFLQKNDPGKLIISRLPLVSFYSDSVWSDLLYRMQDSADVTTCGSFIDQLKKEKANYVIYDDRTGKMFPFMENCQHELALFKEYGDNKEFLKIYRLKE